MLRPRAPIATLLAASAASLLGDACGGWVAPSSGRGPGAGVDGGADAAASSAPCLSACPAPGNRAVALRRPECPAREPALDTPCTRAGLRCGYGGGRTPYCRTEYQCTDGWRLAARALPQCPDLAPRACPATQPEAGGPCVVGALVNVPCEYDPMSCRCAASALSSAGDTGHWLCYGPPADVACPEILPNVGEGCASPGRECWYDPEGCLDSRLYLTCRGGAWEPGSGPKCLR